MELTTIIILAIVAIGLLVAESFVPGGILGTFAVILSIIGGVGAFQMSVSAGFIYILTLLAVGGLVEMTVLIYLPKTKIGNVFSLNKDQQNYVANEIDNVKAGDLGVTFTDLRPAGIAVINDLRVDVMADNCFIAKNTAIKVQSVKGYKVLVEEYDSTTEA